MVKKILIALVVILVVIQFIKPEKNLKADPQPNSIKTKFTVPDTVSQLLAVACMDCHSNNTSYPWYNNIQPVAWWLNYHVQEGRKHLNFDEFVTYSLKRQDNKLKEVIESQEDEWMPLDSYTWIHQDAILSEGQRKTLVDWAKGLRKQIQGGPEFATAPAK